jgi:hypothetical protein
MVSHAMPSQEDIVAKKNVRDSARFDCRASL